jgi:hypothetical protein
VNTSGVLESDDFGCAAQSGNANNMVQSQTAIRLVLFMFG